MVNEKTRLGYKHKLFEDSSIQNLRSMRFIYRSQFAKLAFSKPEEKTINTTYCLGQRATNFGAACFPPQHGW